MTTPAKNLTRLYNLILHRGFVFFKKTRSLFPIILWLLILFLCYDVSYPPINAAEGYLSAVPWFFIVMVLFGYLFLDSVNIVEEYILILQINSRFLYTVSKILFLIILSAAMGLVGCVFPVVIQLVQHYKGFTFIPNGIGVADFLSAFVLHFIIGVVGVSLAYFFQPNPGKPRNGFMLLLLFLFTLLAFTKEQIFGLQGAYAYILFIFTPVVDIVRLFTDQDAVSLKSLLTAALYAILYCAAAIAAGTWLYNKRVYGSLIAETKK